MNDLEDLVGKKDWSPWMENNMAVDKFVVREKIRKVALPLWRGSSRYRKHVVEANVQHSDYG
jgi:hypothetical protein